MSFEDFKKAQRFNNVNMSQSMLPQGADIKTRVVDGDRRKAKKSLEIALSQGVATGGWSSDHREEVRHFTGWNYIAIDAIGTQWQQAKVNAYVPELQESKMKGHYGEAADKGQPLDPEHPLLKVCKRPNPNQSGAVFRYEQAMQLGLTGKCLVWNQKNRWGKVIRRYIIPTSIAEPRTPIEEFPEGYYRI
jgi:hypothetical protein